LKEANMRIKKGSLRKVLVLSGALIFSAFAFFNAPVFAAEQKFDLKMAFAVEVPENDKA
jgi:hypothetical protein